jgi:hypothetical protein
MLAEEFALVLNARYPSLIYIGSRVAALGIVNLRLD